MEVPTAEKLDSECPRCHAPIPFPCGETEWDEHTCPHCACTYALECYPVEDSIGDIVDEGVYLEVRSVQVDADLLWRTIQALEAGAAPVGVAQLAKALRRARFADVE